MIAGSAPPSEHKTQHQDGGSDEMDLTGLSGAGGVAFPLRGLWVDDSNAGDDRWYEAYTGSGSLTKAYTYFTLQTGSTNPSTAYIYRKMVQSIPALTWANKRHILFQWYIDVDETSSCILYMLTGLKGNFNNYGFKITGGKLYGVSSRVGGNSEVEILTYPQAFIGLDTWLEAIFYPGDRIDFWVDGNLEQTLNTNLPTGTSRAEYIAYVFLDNNNTGNNVGLLFNHIQMYQE